MAYCPNNKPGGMPPLAALRRTLGAWTCPCGCVNTGAAGTCFDCGAPR